jgi:DNA-binding FrmR family transcriptional regulator
MIHASHPDVIARLKRAHGHLASVIQMIEAGRPCADLAQQLHAVEKAVGNAKRELIRDHIDNCLEGAVGLGGRRAKDAMAEVKAITKYL